MDRFDPDATRAGRFMGPAEATADPMSGADTAVVVADDGAGIESADGGELVLCSFERVSDKENEDDLPLDSLLPGPPEHHEQASGQASGAGKD